MAPIFEGARKILIVGLPVFLEPGTPGQLICGLMLCFATSIAYCTFKPFESPEDDMLSTACQVATFFALLASLVTKTLLDTLLEAVLVRTAPARPSATTTSRSSSTSPRATCASSCPTRR